MYSQGNKMQLSKAENVRALVVLKACADFQAAQGRPPFQRELREPKGEDGLVPRLWLHLDLYKRYPYGPTLPQVQDAVALLGRLGYMLERGGEPREGRTRSRKPYTVTEAGLEFARALGPDPMEWPLLEVTDGDE